MLRAELSTHKPALCLGPSRVRTTACARQDISIHSDIANAKTTFGYKLTKTVVCRKTHDALVSQMKIYLEQLWWVISRVSPNFHLLIDMLWIKVIQGGHAYTAAQHLKEIKQLRPFIMVKRKGGIRRCKSAKMEADKCKSC